MALVYHMKAECYLDNWIKKTKKAYLWRRFQKCFQIGSNFNPEISKDAYIN